MIASPTSALDPNSGLDHPATRYATPAVMNAQAKDWVSRTAIPATRRATPAVNSLRIMPPSLTPNGPEMMRFAAGARA